MAQSNFDYKARDRSGKLVKGKIQADDMALVSSTLREKGFIPISITPSSNMSADIKIPGLTDRVNLKAVSVMSRQFATMVDSGLTLVRSISVLADQTEDKNLASILHQVQADIEQGASLSSALLKHPKAFSTLYCAMVRAGEIGGNLDSVLNKLATTVEKQVELRRIVRSAMSYPVVVLGVVMLIFFAMMLFIVPIFKKLFAQINAPLPGPTLLLVTISNAMLSIWALVFLAAIIAVIVAFIRWHRTENGQVTVDKIKLRLPIFGKLAHKAALARFTSTLSSLVSSGVPLVEALEIVADTAGNKVVEKAIRDSREGIRNGRPLAAMLAEHDVMPSMVTHLIDTGEQTGALDALLEKIAEFYDNEVRASVESLTSILEPLLIVIIGGMVGFIVISLYMPMFSFIKDMQKQGAGS